MKTHALTLGKFAPLHKGHQYIIETAIKETDECTVIIYDTDVTNISLPVRSNWIKTLYPGVNVIEAYNGPLGEPHDREYEKAEEEFIKKLIEGKNITHFYCSEYYGEHVAKALHAIDRRIDEKREHMPISGSMIRENAYRYREYIDSVVYRDLVTKAVFLGAESTGKSTIAEYTAKKYNTCFVEEYGREYWLAHQIDKKLTLEDLENIAVGHIKKEEEAFQKSNTYCFIDTSAVTTYMYSMLYHNKATPLLEKLAFENAKRYDIFFLCSTDIPYEDTWDRYGKDERKNMHLKIKDELQKRGIEFTELFGTLEERTQKVSEVIEKLRKR